VAGDGARELKTTKLDKYMTKEEYQIKTNKLDSLWEKLQQTVDQDTMSLILELVELEHEIEATNFIR